MARAERQIRRQRRKVWSESSIGRRDLLLWYHSTHHFIPSGQTGIQSQSQCGCTWAIIWLQSAIAGRGSNSVVGQKASINMSAFSRSLLSHCAALFTTGLGRWVFNQMTKWHSEEEDQQRSLLRVHIKAEPLPTLPRRDINRGKRSGRNSLMSGHLRKPASLLSPTNCPKPTNSQDGPKETLQKRVYCSF